MTSSLINLDQFSPSEVQIKHFKKMSFIDTHTHTLIEHKMGERNQSKTSFLYVLCIRVYKSTITSEMQRNKI